MYPLQYLFHINNKSYEVVAMNFITETITIYDDQVGQHIEYPIQLGIVRAYTGVVDSHNKKLYVGDIVQVTPMLIENIQTYTATIVWDKYRFALYQEQKNPGVRFIPPLSNLDSFGLQLVRIGSIYETNNKMEG